MKIQAPHAVSHEATTEAPLTRRQIERKHSAVMHLIHQKGRDDLIEGCLFAPFSRYERWKRLLNTLQRARHSRSMIQRAKRNEYAAFRRWAAALVAVYNELTAMNTGLHQRAA